VKKENRKAKSIGKHTDRAKLENGDFRSGGFFFLFFEGKRRAYALLSVCELKERTGPSLPWYSPRDPTD